ncbi:MAG: glycosyl hydrolase-related protein, partial [Clostridium sp.]
ILRMFEYFNGRGKVNVTLGAKVASVQECDLMENAIGDVQVAQDGKGFAFDIKPYEIKTFKVVFDK